VCPAAVGICSGLSFIGVVIGVLYYTTHRAQIPEVAGASLLAVAG
jgi:hypothetical protein